MAAPLKRLSVDDYLALEQSSDTKHEFFDGEIFDMAGGKASHSLVAVNLSAELRIALKARGCRVYSSDMMVFCPTGLRTYPDVSVTCESPRYEDDRELTLLNPILLVEALSDSMTTDEGAYDRDRKFNHYQSILSLREYLLVSTDRAHVDHFTRLDDGRWALMSYDGLETAVELPTLNAKIAMSETYTGVEFPPEPPLKPGPQGL
jgi:Uma2 family endonuclease